MANFSNNSASSNPQHSKRLKIEKPAQLVIVVLILIGFNWTGNLASASDYRETLDSSASEINPQQLPNNFDANITKILQLDEKNRLRRNILLSPNILNGQSQNIEGLLSACQLTNLLLYQLINQKFSSTGTNADPQQYVQQPYALIPGLGVGAEVNQNSFNAPILQTYLSTATTLNEMTTTSTHTVTLMFGNKESTAVITDTKIFNITSSQIFTLTSTIQPTKTVPEDIEISTTLAQTHANSEHDEDLGAARYGKGRKSLNIVSTPVLEIGNGKPSRLRRKHKRKQQPVVIETEIIDEFGAPARKYSRQENSYTVKKQKPYADTEPIVEKDYAGNNFYIRRPKRRGDEVDNYEPLSSDLDAEYENSELPLAKEYLLEPSSDGLSDESVEERCPKPVEITVTKTVTKFVNAHSSIKFNTGDFNIHDIRNSTNALKTPPVPENFNNKERRAFRPKPRDTSPIFRLAETFEPVQEISQPSTRRFRNSASSATTTERVTLANKFRNNRASFSPKTSTSKHVNNESLRPSSKFVRNRSRTQTSTTTSPEYEIASSDQVVSSRRSSRYRSTTKAPETDESSDGDTDAAENLRYSDIRSRINYREAETTTRFSSKFKNRFSSRNESPEYLPSTVGSTTPENTGETTESKYNKLKSRFSPTT